jgi:hypothetical protein
MTNSVRADFSGLDVDRVDTSGVDHLDPTLVEPLCRVKGNVTALSAEVLFAQRRARVRHVWVIGKHAHGAVGVLLAKRLGGTDTGWAASNDEQCGTVHGSRIPPTRYFTPGRVSPMEKWAILAGMEQQDIPQPTPRDARKATEEQREQQDELDHRNDDPDAPGGHQDRHQLADET